MIKVLVTDRLSVEAMTYLKSQEDFFIQNSLHPTPTSDELKDTKALLIRSRTKINDDLLNKAPSLKVVVTATSGFDHIDLNTLMKRSVTVMYTPEGNKQSVAELTIGLLLACSRKIVPAYKMMKSGNWDRNQLLGEELFGKSFGIIGLGRIGSLVSQMAKSFGMKIFAYDPYIEFDRFSELGVTSLGLIELLRISDIISLHVPYTKETHHMINRSTISEMSSQPILLNTSRGFVVNESDLLLALNKGQVRGAGLDVFEIEPLSRESPLLQLPQVVLTPHIGANTLEAFHKVSLLATERLIDFLRSGKIIDGLLS